MKQDVQADRRKFAIAARDVVGTGGGTVAIETARCMRAAGHDVCLVVDTNVDAIVDGIKVHVTPFGPLLKAWRPWGKISFRLQHMLQMFAFTVFGRSILARYKREGFITIDHNLEAWGGDIVVVHNVFIEQYRADKRRLLRKLPQFLNPVFGFRLLRERWILGSTRVRGVIAVSQSTLREALPYISPNKSHQVIESGINLTKFQPLPEHVRDSRRRDAGLLQDQFVLIFAGHEFERKRLDLVISALALLPETAVLRVIGGRMSVTEKYRMLGQRLGVSHRLSFLGTHANPSAEFQLADVFVLPSDYETWGLVTLEAMACGVPAIMTPVGCAPHVIIDGENGFVVPSDAAAIAARVGLLMASSALRTRARTLARSTAEGYGWNGVADKYVEFAVTALSPYAHGA